MARLGDTRMLLRAAAVAAVVLVLGGLVLQRELADRSDGDAAGAPSDGRPAEGELAPDFTLTSPEGARVALSDFRGKTVVLNFWATWCPPCRAEMPELQAVWEERGEGRDLVVLAVDVEESADAVARFVESLGLTFPVVLDVDGAVADHYGLPGLPSTFFIDADGVLRSRVLGPVFGELLEAGIAAADAGGAVPRPTSARPPAR
ncbi:MAG: TlpA disulfide reductase family protein [Chloroflexi bacterium]|nr:TlpA disulfide reductase family protein [Chloroflexota bacterium]